MLSFRGSLRCASMHVVVGSQSPDSVPQRAYGRRWRTIGSLLTQTRKWARLDLPASPPGVEPASEILHAFERILSCFSL